MSSASEISAPARLEFAVIEGLAQLEEALRQWDAAPSASVADLDRLLRALDVGDSSIEEETLRVAASAVRRGRPPPARVGLMERALNRMMRIDGPPFDAGAHEFRRVESILEGKKADGHTLATLHSFGDPVFTADERVQLGTLLNVAPALAARQASESLLDRIEHAQRQAGGAGWRALERVSPRDLRRAEVLLGSQRLLAHSALWGGPAGLKVFQYRVRKVFSRPAVHERRLRELIPSVNGAREFATATAVAGAGLTGVTLVGIGLAEAFGLVTSPLLAAPLLLTSGVALLAGARVARSPGGDEKDDK